MRTAAAFLIGVLLAAGAHHAIDALADAAAAPVIELQDADSIPADYIPPGDCDEPEC